MPQGSEGQDGLPLVIRAHGGGFILNNPAADDKIARDLADTARCLVVSIDYSKVPQHKFPAGYEDVVAQVLAIVEDPDLAFDRSRVLFCGSSAGGNLLLGAAQDSRLRSKVRGVAAIYPPLDLRQAAMRRWLRALILRSPILWAVATLVWAAFIWMKPISRISTM